MNITEQVRQMVARREPRNPDGGIGGLTTAESDALNDLLNADPPCRCESCACHRVPKEPRP